MPLTLLRPIKSDLPPLLIHKAGSKKNNLKSTQIESVPASPERMHRIFNHGAPKFKLRPTSGNFDSN